MAIVRINKGGEFISTLIKCHYKIKGGFVLAEKDKFVKLCNYIKKNILRYDDDKKTPRYLILRLRGLSRGQFIANKKQEAQASYDWDVIYMTFVFITPYVNSYIDKNKDKINGENHLINLVMKVAEEKINDVAQRVKEKEFSKRMLASIDNSQAIAPRSTYKRKTEDKRFRRDLK